MRFRTENILLCILWLLAVTLGASFWFNTIFGFNIFSPAHWEYVASLQATHSPIKTGFYVSMAITIFIFLFGFYLIVRPRIRKIRLPIMKIDINKHIQEHKEPINNQSQNQQQNVDASTLDILPAEVQTPQTKTSSMGSTSSSRPPRLTLPTLNGNYVSPPSAPTLQSNSYIDTRNSEQDSSELTEIFNKAGYTVKPNARVNGILTSIIAIGANESMWVGCIGIKTTDVRRIIEKFQQVFSDTLDETEIEINGFAIAAPDAATSEFQDILMFNTINELRDYMQQRPNPTISGDDEEMFDAYSQYIDAVITHIGKI